MSLCFKPVLFAAFFLLFPSGHRHCHAQENNAEHQTPAWKEVKGEHFIVYHASEDGLAKDVIDKAEDYYHRIASDLGYPRHSDFWTWEKRVKIYIHPNRDAYLKDTGQPGWSEGMADHERRQIVSYAWSRGFLESLLPHELAHLILRDFIGFKGEAPLWLDEGVAQWEEPALRPELEKKAKALYEKDSLLSIGDITRLNIRLIDKNEKRRYCRGVRTRKGRIGLLMLSPDVLINTFYIEAGSLVGFLMETFGSERFSIFCRQLRDGKTLQEALTDAYPDHIRSARELEDHWRAYLRDIDIKEEKSKKGE